MMKKIISVMVTLALLLSISPMDVVQISAETISNPLNYLEYEIEDNQVTITGCDKSISGELEIPSEIEGYPVTRIGEEAFYECLLTKIVIPYGVTFIGNYAFARSNFTDIKLPSSVEKIQSGAFAHCYDLLNIELPDNLVSIGPWILENTPIYENAENWNDNVLYVDNCLLEVKSTFKGECRILQNTRIIANSAFFRTGITSVIIPDSVIYIGEEAFYECTELSNVNFGSSVKGIGESAFRFCSNLKNVILPDSITSMGNSVFEASGIENINIPYGITKIQYAMFWGCSNLKAITIPDNVKSIEVCAFSGCTNLKKVVLPKEIYIEFQAFDECDNLTDVYYNGYEFDREKTVIESGWNEDLLNAKWHYGTCENNRHVYTGDCDTDCDNCDWVREIDIEHIYDNNDDIICNICNSVRDGLGDVDEDGDCDINDLKMLKEALLLSKEYISNYDTNKDGLFNICDYVFLYYSCYLKNN